jgi:hypothetical protein
LFFVCLFVCSSFPTNDRGNGGHGGAAATAGSGGKVVVASQDARLLALVVCDARAGFRGVPGAGGSAGVGGSGGAGGSGGSGGSGGHGGPSRQDNEGKTVVHAGSSGNSGRSGSSGHSGSPSHSGHAGSPGQAAHEALAGAVSFAVLDVRGNVVQSSPTCYDLAVSAYMIDDKRGDLVPAKYCLVFVFFCSCFIFYSCI